MTSTPIQHNRLEMALRNNGYHIEYDVGGDWLAADATFAPGRCFVAYVRDGSDRCIVATSLAHVVRTYTEEGGTATSAALPPGAIAAFATDIESLPAVVRRIFELSCALPSAPLDRFAASVRSLPRDTEAERLVVQRIGQDIFRGALMDLWFRRCAVTGLDQPELLRASHMKPWKDCANDAERLDPYNGLLLAAHWDAAFDRGLVTFEDNGMIRLSPSLTLSARSLLISSPSWSPRIADLRADHLPYLAHHRNHVWRSHTFLGASADL